LFGILFRILFFFAVEDRIVGVRSELVTDGAEKSECRRLGEEVSEPDPSERKGGVQKIHDDPSEIDVGDDDEVELAEEFQLLEVFGGLAVDLRGLFQVLDGPDDGDEDRAATDDVDESEDIFPGEPSLRARGGFFDDDHGDVVQHLEGNNDEEDLLVLIGQERFDEGPSSSDEGDDDEHHDALEEGEEVVDGGPCARGSIDFEIVEVDGFEQDGEGLQE